MRCDNIKMNLKRFRLSRGANQLAIAVYAGVDTKTYVNWENNRSHPNIEQLFLLATYLGCRMEELIEFKIGAGKDEVNI